MKQNPEEAPFRLKKSFVFYMIAAGLFAFGFTDFTLITLHAAGTGAFPASSLSLLYAGAMAADALAALFFGRLFDRIGLKSLVVSITLSAAFPCFIFLSGSPLSPAAGIILWGTGMGAQESIMKAAVAKAVPVSMRAAGFGIFETCFGIFWFLGRWLTGYLYDINPAYTAAVSAATIITAALSCIVCVSTESGKQNNSAL